MHTLVQEIMMSSCPYSTNYAHQTNTINRPHIFNTSLQGSDDDERISTTSKWDTSNIYTYTTSKWIIMDSKGKAPVQDYAQSKRLPMGHNILIPFVNSVVVFSVSPSVSTRSFGAQLLLNPNPAPKISWIIKLCC